MRDVNEMLDYEKEYQKKGYKFIAGVDEVGRGPLAGPVATACVIMDLENLVEGVDDSKKLSEKKREQLYDQIISRAVSYKISYKSPEDIDKYNILEATKMCMSESVNELDIKPDVVFVDALKLDAVDIEQCSIIKGDAKSYSIACASIIAKVARDRLMVELDEKYPEYNFKKHKGYGTAEHIKAIKEHGPCPLHRKSFIKNFVGGEN